MSKVDVINVITAPEIEMLIVLNEGKYDAFKKSRKKPSEYCKTDLKMSNVKSYAFVSEYFQCPETLLRAIKIYDKVTKSRKDEYTLMDLLKDVR